MNNIIPFNVPEQREVECSFCKKPESIVKNMIAGHDKMYHICNECVTKASDRMKVSTTCGSK